MKKGVYFSYTHTLDAFTGQTDAESNGDAKKEMEPKEQNRNRLKKAIVQVEHDGRSARIILNRRPPPAEGFAWLKYEGDGQEFEAELAQVKLVALLKG